VRPATDPGIVALITIAATRSTPTRRRRRPNIFIADARQMRVQTTPSSTEKVRH
jgi:hypothetical protein